LIDSGRNGLLARFDEAPEFIRQALRLAGDADAARAMGLQARQSACELDWDRIVGQIEAVFVAAMRGSGETEPASGLVLQRL
jgi:hypothetical protein